MAETSIHTQVLAHSQLSDTAYVLRLARKGLVFRAGECVSLFGASLLDARDYTIASGEGDEALEVLYRLMPEGVLTPQLAALQPGDPIQCAGPYGTFLLRDADVPVVFIATGTGIAPCRAFHRSYPGLDLTVLHGARVPADLFYREEWDPTSYYPCVSSVSCAGFQGRVTDRIKQVALPSNAHFYLCGANEMIYEVSDWLVKSGFASEQIFREPYYYRADD
ncbi:MAG: NAD(P)H-flavin reductase [Kiritimatiellia bacterium]|jgi:ferredoxin/flavodoxin---NADP+ reductase